MGEFKGGQFTRIKGVSDRRRLPRLGKIRLGVKAVSKKTGKEFPKEVDYFVCPEEVRKVYGDQPKELDVMVPVNDVDVIFPQAYVWYGSSRGAKCRGNGEQAIRVNEQTGEMENRECPCELLEQKKCQRRAHLLVLLPKVSLGGIYQIDLGSYHSIVDINSGLDYVEALVGRFAMIPLILRRTPRETHGSGQKETHYTLQLLANVDVSILNQLRENTTKVLMGPQYALPAPEDLNPAMDQGAVIEMVEDEENGKETPASQPEVDPFVSSEIIPYLKKWDMDPVKVGIIVNLPPASWTKETAPAIKGIVKQISTLMKTTKKAAPELLDQLVKASEPKVDPGLDNQLSGKRVDRKGETTCPKDGEFRTGGWCMDMCMEFIDCKSWERQEVT